MSVAAQGLRYRVSGIDGEARDNVRAFLGDSPRDAPATERFLVTAPERAAQALEALGYYDPLIDLRVDRSATPWRAELSVQLGTPVRYSAVDVLIEGPGADDETLLKVVRELAPSVGDTVHHGRYTALKATLARRARERGYFDARFSLSEVRVDAAAGSAEAQLRFASGERLRFGAVTAPEEQISAGLLAAIQPFSEGDPYSQEQLLALRAALLRLGYFTSVVVAPDLAARAGGAVPVTVDLLPAPRHSYELGVGFSTDTRQRLSLVWSSPRLNRWGHSQQTRLRYSPVNPALRTLYSVPLDDPATDLLQFGARLEDNEYGDLESRQRELLLQRETSRGSRVSSYSLRGLRESWSAASEEFEADYLLAGLSYSTRMRSGDAVDPRAGLSQYYDLEAASSALGSDENLLRLSGTVTGLRRFGERSRVVARVSGGILYGSSDRPDELPPSLAFFAGGDNSIRGYAYQSIGRQISARALDADGPALVVGGTRLLTGSIEYQHYLFDDWRAAVFVDGGDAFVEGDFEMNVGVGIGLHYLTPLGALRVEVASPVTADSSDLRLHINIGAEL